MVVNLKIQFNDNPSLVFFSGQTIAGKVEVTVDKPVKIQRLVLKIEGTAHCEWSTSSSTNSQSSSTYYKADEKYIDSTNNLINNLLTIAPGKHVYNFMCLLPENVPTSVEEEKGYIRYTASATLERPWKLNITNKIRLTVIRPIDLNKELPNSRLPLSCEVNKSYFGFVWPTKSIIVTATLPMTAFVGGQIVPITINIVNATRSNINWVEIKFVKICLCHVYHPRKAVHRIKKVIHENDCVVSAGKVEKFFQIPFVAPSTFNKSKIVDVSYEIHIKAKASGCHRIPKIKFPVVIGTVPYGNLQIPSGSVAPNQSQLSSSAALLDNKQLKYINF